MRKCGGFAPGLRSAFGAGVAGQQPPVPTPLKLAEDTDAVSARSGELVCRLLPARWGFERELGSQCQKIPSLPESSAAFSAGVSPCGPLCFKLPGGSAAMLLWWGSRAQASRGTHG